jgi:hypothetical protein
MNCTIIFVEAIVAVGGKGGKMQATGTGRAFNRCLLSAEVLSDDLAAMIDLHACSPRVFVDGLGSSLATRQRLLDRVVHSMEAYCVLLDDLTSALDETKRDNH